METTGASGSSSGSVGLVMAAGGVMGSGNVVWEELRKDARKLEGDIDVKLSSYSKLCSMLCQTGYRDSSGSAAAAGDALSKDGSSTWRAMEVEIEALLERLRGVNDSMAQCVAAGTITAAAPSVNQKLARHRDILQEFHQEFRRTRANMSSMREHAELLSSVAPMLPHEGRSGATSPSMRQHLTERKAIAGNISQMDELIGQATATKSALSMQRSVLVGVRGRLKLLSERFPVVRNILAMIRRKRSRDTIILAAVVAACTTFLLIYWLLK